MNKLILFLIGVLLSTASIAQNLTIEAGLVLPIGEFGQEKDIVINNGGFGSSAGLGYVIALGYSYPFIQEKLSGYAAFSFNRNKQNNAAKETLKKAYNAEEVTGYKYSSLPLILGLKYTKKQEVGIGFFAQAGVGYSLISASSFNAKIDGNELIVDFDKSTGLAYEAAVGVSISNAFQFSFKYTGLGKRNVDGEIIKKSKADGVEDAISKIDWAFNPSLFSFNFGVNL